MIMELEISTIILYISFNTLCNIRFWKENAIENLKLNILG